MNDILKAIGYAAVVYLLFNTLISFGSGRPLVEWINPGRRYLPVLALVLFGSAYGSLRFAVARYQKSHLDLLVKLVSEEQAPPEVVGALSFIIFGITVLMLFGYCWFKLPRAANTFNPNPKDLLAEYRRALRHYVRWSGGLDFAALCEIRDGKLQVIAEGGDDRSTLRGLNRLPGVHIPLDGKTGAAAADAQKLLWREMALGLFDRWKAFDELVRPARHGGNVAIAFDLKYGAMYAEMVEAPSADGAVGVFLFAATLNQHEVSTFTAGKHFAMLSQAVRHIRTGVTR
jgi:hypothetical protein